MPKENPLPKDHHGRRLADVNRHARFFDLRGNRFVRLALGLVNEASGK